MASTIPSVQQAVVIENPGHAADFRIRSDIPVGEPGPHEVLVRLAFTGLWYAMHLASPHPKQNNTV